MFFSWECAELLENDNGHSTLLSEFTKQRLKFKKKKHWMWALGYRIMSLSQNI